MEQQENKFELLKGDKVLWMVIILISFFFSVFPVYSASSNLEYIVQNGQLRDTLSSTCFCFLRFSHYESCRNCKIRTHRKTESILLGIMVILLFCNHVYGIKKPTTSASHWLKISEHLFLFNAFAHTPMLILSICADI